MAQMQLIPSPAMKKDGALHPGLPLWSWKVDLGANKTVTKFVIKHWALTDPDTLHTVHDYTIKVSTDNVNFTTVVTASSAVGARQYSPPLRSLRWNRISSAA